ncbi:hypothetical protein FOZ63_000924, partial [Perkinsus olseni]
RITPCDPTSVQLVAHLKVDDHEVFPLVDTQSPNTFFIWEKWLEDEFPGRCAELLFKCYECNPGPCTGGPLTDVETLDKVEVGIFKHSGRVYFKPGGDVFADGIEFGLVAEAEGPPYASLVQQLIQQPEPQRLIESEAFSVYLTAGENPSGELILGGKDQGKYIGPLQNVLVVNQGNQVSFVASFGIGDVTKNRVFVGEPGLFDTGSNVLVMPWDIAGHALHWLETAGQASVTIREDRGFFEISCQDAKYLPSITYFMEAWNGEEVPLEIPSTSYVYKKTEAICILAITFRDRWILGLPALIGHYFLYDWQNGQIGFAKVSV